MKLSITKLCSFALVGILAACASTPKRTPSSINASAEADILQELGTDGSIELKILSASNGPAVGTLKIIYKDCQAQASNDGVNADNNISCQVRLESQAIQGEFNATISGSGSNARMKIESAHSDYDLTINLLLSYDMSSRMWTGAGKANLQVSHQIGHNHFTSSYSQTFGNMN